MKILVKLSIFVLNVPSLFAINFLIAILFVILKNFIENWPLVLVISFLFNKIHSFFFNWAYLADWLHPWSDIAIIGFCNALRYIEFLEEVVHALSFLFFNKLL